MRVFRSPKHAASWAGLCPGNHESGGKRLSNRTRKGTAGCEGRSARPPGPRRARRTAFFYRKAGKHGIIKAIVATAHHLLVIAYCMLRDGAEYRELGGDYFDQLHPRTDAQPVGAETAAAGSRCFSETARRTLYRSRCDADHAAGEATQGPPVSLRQTKDPLYSLSLEQLSFRRN
jgi:hypothetical protein